MSASWFGSRPGWVAAATLPLLLGVAACGPGPGPVPPSATTQAAAPVVATNPLGSCSDLDGPIVAQITGLAVGEVQPGYQDWDAHECQWSVADEPEQSVFVQYKPTSGDPDDNRQAQQVSTRVAPGTTVLRSQVFGPGNAAQWDLLSGPSSSGTPVIALRVVQTLGTSQVMADVVAESGAGVQWQNPDYAGPVAQELLTWARVHDAHQHPPARPDAQAVPRVLVAILLAVSYRARPNTALVAAVRNSDF